MAKEYAKQFYKSKAWQDCRASFIAQRRAIDGGLCMKCGKDLGYIVHHKIYLTPANIKDPNVALNHGNLLFWCKACHDDEHLDNHNDKPLLCGFDENGRPINGTTTERNQSNT